MTEEQKNNQRVYEGLGGSECKITVFHDKFTFVETIKDVKITWQRPLYP